MAHRKKSPIKKPHATGSLIIVGGREDKEKERRILKVIVVRNGNGHMVIATVASAMASDLWKEYKSVFTHMGVKHISHLHVDQAEDARDPDVIKIMDKAKTVFFTGGDQLKITTKIGGTPIFQRMLEIYESGGIIAGTSAGASMMGETMLVGSEATESHKVGNWMMAPGLGLVKNMIIDQHFAQRGRIGRLLGAVALNPGVLGIGIDEDTAIIVEDGMFKVVGTNAVYVVDGTAVTYTNISEAAAEKTMSMHNVKIHILSCEEVFDLQTRTASVGGREDQPVGFLHR